MFDSDDDAPLVKRAPTKSAAAAVTVKTEPEEPKPVVVTKVEVKEEIKHDVKTGVVKEQKPVLAKVKEEDKKPTAAKAKPAAKAGGDTQNGKPAGDTTKAKTEAKQPREKKEYDMPGQTREAPSETDSLRKFYTSLLDQRPDSELAKKWCLMHGLLSRDAAEELVAQVKKTKTSAAVKSPTKVARPDSSKAAKPRRPAERGPVPKKQRQALSPPKRKPAKYSDEESASTSGSEEDDEDQPLVRSRPGTARSAATAAKTTVAAAKSTAAAAVAKKPAVAAAVQKRRPLKGQDKPFADGGLDDSDDDDIPLGQRVQKK